MYTLSVALGIDLELLGLKPLGYIKLNVNEFVRIYIALSVIQSEFVITFMMHSMINIPILSKIK